MSNPFDSEAMAAGYAQSRPPVHPKVIELARDRFEGRRFRRILDVGCGAGISTAPLGLIADSVVGIEPNSLMLRWADSVAPAARFVAGSAEALPFRAATFDAISAAGALNYVDLEKFFAEAERILEPGGAIVVYDFSQGRSFVDSDDLDRWFLDFMERFPPPAGEGRELTPESLGDTSFTFGLSGGERFEIPIPLEHHFYVDYAMTETNVAAAIRRGVEPDKIREWCSNSLEPLFRKRTRDVLFRGYVAYFERKSR